MIYKLIYVLIVGGENLFTSGRKRLELLINSQYMIVACFALE